MPSPPGLAHGEIAVRSGNPALLNPGARILNQLQRIAHERPQREPQPKLCLERATPAPLPPCTQILPVWVDSGDQLKETRKTLGCWEVQVVEHSYNISGRGLGTPGTKKATEYACERYRPRTRRHERQEHRRSLVDLADSQVPLGIATSFTSLRGQRGPGIPSTAGGFRYRIKAWLRGARGSMRGTWRVG